MTRRLKRPRQPACLTPEFSSFVQRFAQLFQALDASTATGDKVAALVRYFGNAPAADAA